MNLSCFVARSFCLPRRICCCFLLPGISIYAGHIRCLLYGCHRRRRAWNGGGDCVVERLVHNRRRSSFSQPERPRNVFSAPRPLAPSDADKTKTFFSSPVHHERKRLYTSTDASSSGKGKNKKEINGKKIKKKNKQKKTRR